MKVATLEKFHLRGGGGVGGGNQDPRDPGVGKVGGGGERIFFPLSRGGTDPGWHSIIQNLHVIKVFFSFKYETLL